MSRPTWRPFLLPVLALALGSSLPGPLTGVRAAHAEEGPRVWGRVAVTEEGFVRVPAAELSRIGAPPAAGVHVRRRGHPVPVTQRGGDLVFLAQGVAGRHTRRAVFEIVTGPPPPARGRPGPAGNAPGSSEPPPAGPGEVPPTATRVLDHDQVLGDLASAEIEAYAADETRPTGYPGASLPVWFLARVSPGAGASLALDPGDAAPGAAQTLEVEVYAAHVGEVVLEASWGGHPLGLARTKGPRGAAGGARLAWEVAPEAVPAEETVLLLRDRSPAAPPIRNDVSEGRGTLWIDRVLLTGPVLARLGVRLAHVDALPGREVALALPAHAPEPAPGEAFAALVGPQGEDLGPVEARAEGGALRVAIPQVPAGSRLFFALRAADGVVEAAGAPADPLARAAGARHVILAVPPLLAPARRLAEHRTRQGLPSAVVPVIEVYERYGHGEHVPEAIAAFVDDLEARRDAPLEHLVLAGDATYDRTDLLPLVTIPAPVARTKYNGATASDRLYVRDVHEGPLGGPAVGRLPFREAAPMASWVDRLVAYETAPPRDATRRMLRFVTSEGRFGVLADRFIEQFFRSIVDGLVPPAWQVEVTFAKPDSPWTWPAPQFGDKVVDDLNEGSLFYTYVGHGFAEGFDSIRVGGRTWPIFHLGDVPRVAVRGTPPIVLVIACTTAIFDRPAGEGVGEALLARPAGPIAYWGSTRICHPAANGYLGRALPVAMFSGSGPGSRPGTLGEVLARADAETIAPEARGDKLLAQLGLGMMLLAPGEDVARLRLEAAWLYGLLGDPATRPAWPREDLHVEAALETAADAGNGTEGPDVRRVEVRVRTPLADGATVALTLEVTRGTDLGRTERIRGRRDDPTIFDAVRRNHAAANDKVLARAHAAVEGGVARATFTLPAPLDVREVWVRAFATGPRDVHMGATSVPLPR